MSDEELVAAVQRKSGGGMADELYRELLQRYYPRVAAWCLQFAGDREGALDLAQGVFLKVHCGLGSFRGEAKFSTWLYAIARNHCLRATKRKWAEPLEFAEAMPEHFPDARSMDTVLAIERGQSLHILWQLAAECLDETEIRVMTMHYGQEISLDAITRLLNLRNPSGAKAYTVSARRKLTAALQAWRERNLQTTACS